MQAHLSPSRSHPHSDSDLLRFRNNGAGGQHPPPPSPLPIQPRAPSLHSSCQPDVHSLPFQSLHRASYLESYLERELSTLSRRLGSEGPRKQDSRGFWFEPPHCCGQHWSSSGLMKLLAAARRPLAANKPSGKFWALYLPEPCNNRRGCSSDLLTKFLNESQVQCRSALTVRKPQIQADFQ